MVCRPARLTFSLSADQRLALGLIGWTAWGSAHQPRVEPTQAGPLAAPQRVRSPRAPSGVVDVSALAEHPSVVAAVPAAQGGSPTGTRRGEDSAVSTPLRGCFAVGCSCEPATTARLGSAGRPTTTLGGSAEVPTLAACRADRGEHERRLGPQPSRAPAAHLAPELKLMPA